MKPFIAFASLMGLLALPAGAATVLTFNPDNDSYIQRGNANGNFGGANLTIKGNVASTTRKIYTQFDISSIADPNDVIEAQLDVVVQDNNAGGSGTLPHTYIVQLWGLNDGVDESWLEGNITWNNAPGNNTANNDFTGDATLLGSFSLTSNANADLEGSTFGLNSTTNAAFLTFIQNDTDGLVTLMMRRTDTAGSNNLTFFSKEAGGTANDPLLSLTIPEPSSFALLAGSLAFLGLRRRR